MAEVHGSCDDRFAGVREALAQQLDGEELGASIAVDLDGETVVDIWGGYRDEERTTPWTQDTIVNVWSTTKCVLTPGGADAGRARRARRLRAGRQLLAGVLGQGQEGRRGAAPDVAHLGRLRLGAAVLDPRHVRLGDRDRAAGAAAAVVGAGHGVGLPRERTRATWSARSSGGSPTRRSRSSSPTRSPGRWARTSRSAPASRTGTGSRRSSPRRRPTPTRDAGPDVDRGADLHRAGGVGQGGEHAGVAGAPTSGALNGHSNARGVLRRDAG